MLVTTCLSLFCALSAPGAPEDARAAEARHTDTVFEMTKFADAAAWEAFADRLRKRILLSSGLVPMPPETPLDPIVFNRIERDGYSVEKVCIAVRPGFFATGNLYRPKGDGPFPAVVNPHGHWEHGRLEDSDKCSVAARCITLARMGAVAFTYDMIGYVDSRQFVHGWSREQEKLWGIHPFALQLLTSLRAVDFVQSLPEVDRERVGCTGASGGGTQTFALTAIDPRVKVSAPVNMISSIMQGGCVCENAPLIRLENSNMEIGALAAPRPLLMVSATGDWTKNTPQVEFPAVRSVYALYGAEDRVENVHLDFGHNYNQPSREAVYRFFGKHLIGGRDWSAFTEPPYVKEPDDALRVFPDEPGPPPNTKGRNEIIAELVAMQKEKWAAVLPKDATGLDAFRRDYGFVLNGVTGAEVPAPESLRCEKTATETLGGFTAERWVLGRVDRGDAVGAVLFRPQNAGAAEAVLLTHGRGKGALLDPKTGGPGELAAALLKRGAAVLCADLFLQGDGAPKERGEPGKFADTFKPTDTAERVQDILTAAAFLRGPAGLDVAAVAGLEDAGLWCLLAAAMDPAVGRVFADLNGFALDDDDAWAARHYIPCIRSVGDVRTALALVAPRPCLLANANTGELPALTWLGAKAAPDMETHVLAEWLR
ncbi:MAG TPA: acetylxylan esterase [Candidatus Hydrogenedentes bacterium]|nr:acetylxylan esterase [Candidatus Hydrogenedentota bacterium]